LVRSRSKDSTKREKAMNELQEKLFNEYLNELVRTGRTSKNAKYSLRIFFRYLNESGINHLMVRIREAQDFQIYLTTSATDDGSVRFAKASVLNILGSVSSFYEYLRRRKHIHANPFVELDRVRRSSALPRNILNEEKMDAFLKHLKGFTKGSSLREKRQLYRAHVISELMYSTGLRVNEAASLKAADIDFNRGVATVYDSKTGKRREAILNSFAEKVLAIYIEKMREYVLFGKNNADTRRLFGAKTNLRTWLNEILNRESQKLGLGKFTTHNFRHAVGYHLLRAGCDIRYIQEILGHTALHSTQVYTKVDKEDLRNIIDAYHPRRLKIAHEEPFGTSTSSAQRDAQDKPFDETQDRL